MKSLSFAVIYTHSLKRIGPELALLSLLRLISTVVDSRPSRLNFLKTNLSTITNDAPSGSFPSGLQSRCSFPTLASCETLVLLIDPSSDLCEVHYVLLFCRVLPREKRRRQRGRKGRTRISHGIDFPIFSLPGHLMMTASPQQLLSGLS